MIPEIFLSLSAVIISITTLAVNFFLTLKGNKTKHMLEHYTKQRFNELNKLKKLTSELLCETDMDLIEINNVMNIKNIIEKCTELSFCFKPVYKIDYDTMCYLFEFRKSVLEYKNNANAKTKQQLISARLKFEKYTYLYIHSAWGCIKKQILDGKVTQYKEFERIYNEAIARLISETTL